jgi:1,4-dihydroxy-2-naphthoyl-CoA synthase
MVENLARGPLRDHVYIFNTDDDSHVHRGAFLEKRDPDWDDFPWHY